MELPGKWGTARGCPGLEAKGRKSFGEGRGVVAVSMLLRAQKVCGLRTQLGAGNAVVTANLGWCRD